MDNFTYHTWISLLILSLPNFDWNTYRPVDIRIGEKGWILIALSSRCKKPRIPKLKLPLRIFWNFKKINKVLKFNKGWVQPWDDKIHRISPLIMSLPCMSIHSKIRHQRLCASKILAYRRIHDKGAVVFDIDKTINEKVLDPLFIPKRQGLQISQ